MATYKELKIWQENQVCIKDALELMKDLPVDYAFQHIGKQLFRAITSIGANIAEGHDNYRGKEFIRYIDIATRSAIEADHWLATLHNLGIEDKEISGIVTKNLEVIKMMKGLKNSILNSLKTNN